MNIFSDDNRRNPYPLYAQLRSTSPVLHVPPPFDGWLIFDYDGVKWALNDVETFSSRIPAPPWFIFTDPPQHTKLRGLISRAFTPRMIANLEPRIRELSRELLDAVAGRDEIDLATEYSAILPMKVIASILGIPLSDWAKYRHWSDIVLRLSYSRSGGEEAARSRQDFKTVSEEMGRYVAEMIEERRRTPQDDLITHLIEAEVDGERLSHQDMLGFFQVLLIAGQETTADLINNAILSFIENPGELERLRANPELMPSAIEEVLRYRSPLQWMMRAPRRDVEINGQTIPAGKLVLTMIGSANRDPKQFPAPDRFDITREPNPHIAFGHGIHFCLGAALSRLETRIALSDLLGRFRHFELATTDAWPPRRALHVLGPAHLPLRVERDRTATGAA
jgi:cytochrome P450